MKYKLSQMFLGNKLPALTILLFRKIYLIGENKIMLKFFKKQEGFPGSETWRNAKRVLADAKTSPSSTTGFVILFAVTLSALLLGIALGVSNIALREVRFGTNARDTNDAFFAADNGIESVFFEDRTGGLCLPTPPLYTPTECPYVISKLGSGDVSCAKVKLTKINTSVGIAATIISKGYNNGGSDLGKCDPSPNAVERELKATY